MAITGTHAIIYAAHPDQTRAFLRDVLGMPHVDAGDGWLIFKTPPAELGVHPTHPDQPATGHELYLMCDDIGRPSPSSPTRAWSSPRRSPTRASASSPHCSCPEAAKSGSTNRATRLPTTSETTAYDHSRV